MTTNDIKSPDRFDYSEPVKRIHDSQGLHHFQSSVALYEIQKSLTKIVQLVESKEVPKGVLNENLLYSQQDIDHYSHDLNAPIPIFENEQNVNLLQTEQEAKPYIKSLLELFDKFSNLIDQVPPLAGPRRYGNLACREWHTKLEDQIDELLKEHILIYYKLENPEGFLIEIKWYIVNAFGSKERLDYGTGHELNFLAFITGLWKTDVLRRDEMNGYDFLIIFGRYFDLVRKLITIYTLEPAGSHGVWGLDDHFHISYILGASEFLNTSKNFPTVSPKMINNKSVVHQYATKNLYFNSISFIYKVKKGAFFEHSPILYDISNVRNWEKILKGMLKMYSAEVVNKFPVVQHFYFGNVLFPWRSIKNNSPLPIHTSEENLSDYKVEEDNDDWRSKVSKHQLPAVTGAPWKTKSNQVQSLQEKLTSPQNSTRTPISHSNIPTTTQAPWATNSTASKIPTTQAPWANTSARPQNQETTKAPWARK